MLRGLIASLLVVLTACANAHGVPSAHPRPAESKVQAPGAPDAMQVLAELLPAGATRCVLARPERIAPVRRALLGRLSQTESFAWLAELAVVAYASARREYRDRPSAQVTLLWVDATPAVARSILDAQSGLVLGWDGEASQCGGSPCVAQAAFVAPHVLRILRGAFEDSSASGVEVSCRDIVAHDPSALELSVTREWSPDDTATGARPLQLSTRLHAIRDGLRLSREVLWPPMSEAESQARERLAGELPAWPMGRVGTEVRREHTADGVHTDYDVLWEDLELLANDDALDRDAQKRAEALAHAEPDEVSLPAETEDVLAALGVRLRLMRESRGAARAVQVEAARSLLEHALLIDPGNEDLGFLLVELLLAECKEPKAARPWLTRLAPAPPNKSRWAPLLREAAALEGENALATALIDEGLADRRRAHISAKEILEHFHGGTRYEQAERMVLTPALP